MNTRKKYLLYFFKETEKCSCGKIKRRRKEEMGRHNIK
jgi:hypothetical protein